MKKNEIKIGCQYLAKVTDKVVSVRIDGENRHGGWDGTNLATGKKVRIKSAQRLRGPSTNGKKAKAATTGASQQTGVAPRSELTLPEAQKLEAARARKKTAAAAQAEVAPTVELATDQPLPEPAQRVKKARKPAADKPKRTSALDAAAEVLLRGDGAMNCKDMITAMSAQGLWSSPNGKTPAATLYSAILREIATKGDQARFRKVQRGQFEPNTVAAQGR